MTVHWRRLAEGAASVAALCSFGIAAQPAGRPTVLEFEPVSVSIEAKSIAQHSCCVRGQAGLISTANEGFNSNAGFVITPEGVVVFDVLGTPALGPRLVELITTPTTQPVRHIVISHCHADHFHGLQAFARMGVDIWAHELVRDHLAGEAPAARLAERRESLTPSVNLTEAWMPLA